MLPAATPVTTPALVTVAFVLSLLTHVPPVVGDNVIVLPTHTEEDGVLTVGALTLIVLDVLLSEVVQPPLAAAMLVTVIVALPGVVKPVAVNCPLPAVVTVIDAVPVPPELLLYVTV